MAGTKRIFAKHQTMTPPRKSLNITDIFERYNNAFGYVSMKVLPRILKAANAFDVYDPNDPTYAETIFTSTKDSSKIYSFGVNGSVGSQAAFPFQADKLPETPVYLAPPLMIRPRRGKTVVRTPIDHSEFEVIEYFGLKVWEVDISGILVDMENHAYPSYLVQQMSEMFAQPGTFTVDGKIWSDLNIHEVFFEQDFELGFVEGYVDTVKFSVKAISTSPVEFLLNGF